MEMAIAKAKKHGFGAVTVRRCNHYGIAGYYARMAADQELIGFSSTNTEAIAIPTFGKQPMEGKCVLFKSFGGVDAFPLCVKTKDVDEFVNAVYLISGSFGGINLEDISAPRCFEIERKLKEKCDIPIFHDDQHGTAVITLAGLTNALKVVGKKKEDVKIVTSGAGAAAISIVRLLLSAGFRNVTMCDRKGAIYAGRDNLNWIKEEMAQVTNLEKKAGSLADMLPTERSMPAVRMTRNWPSAARISGKQVFIRFPRL